MVRFVIADLLAENERLRAENETLQSHLEGTVSEAKGAEEEEWRETERQRDALADALKDADSGLRYIMARYGQLDGIGWERVFGKNVAALRAAGRLPEGGDHG